VKQLKAAVGAALIGISMSLAGCIFISSSAISDKSGSGGTPVSASASDWGFLLLTVPNGLTGKANAQLTSQCASGKLTDVQTELTMRNFLLAQLYNISVDGVCL
jgi:hypothetical protein